MTTNEPSAAAVPGRQQHDKAVSQGAPQEALRLLVVGDCDGLVDTLQAAGQEGFQWEQAPDIAAGLASMREGGFDCALLCCDAAAALQAGDDMPLDGANTFPPLLGLDTGSSGMQAPAGWKDRILDWLRLDELQPALMRRILRHAREKQNLMASEERLALALEAASDGLFDWNVSTGEVYYSPRYCTMLGYEPHELEPSVSAWERLQHPDDLPHSLRKLQRHFQEDGVFEIEFRMRTKEGGWKWILGRGRVVARDEKGAPLRMVGTHVDIDRRKRAEAALKASEERFRVVFEGGGMGIALLNAQGVFLDCNPAYAAMLGHDRSELLGCTFADHTHPEDKQRDVDRFRSLFAGELDHYKTAKRYLRRDGSTMWGTLRVSLVREQGVESPFAIAMLEDLSEMKRTESALRQAKNQAEAANKAKSEFLANMSHEIRTPLNGVLGLLQLMEDTPLSDDQQEFIATALQSGRSLLTVINDILDFSKIEAGKVEICSETFCPRELLRTVEETFRHQAKARGIRFTTHAGDDVPPLLVGDSGRLGQMLFNLVGNAIKFTHQGSVEMLLHTMQPETGQGAEQDVLLTMEVRDSGIGIPEHKLQYIFEPFSQLEGPYTRAFQGTGLGLGIVRRLVDLMQGRIEVSSKEGEGTVMRVLLPLQSAPPGEYERPVQEGAMLPEACLPRLQVLVAEDNRVNQLALTRFLEKEGHKVVCVDNGEEAVGKVFEQHFDCVLMDIQMPGMNGLEATEHIRAASGPRLPIIALTAHAMKGDRERCLEAGMDAYLPKPIDRHELVQVMAAVLARA